NDAGQVVGYADTAANHHVRAFRTAPGSGLATAILLGLGGDFSYAYDIDSARRTRRRRPRNWRTVAANSRRATGRRSRRRLAFCTVVKWGTVFKPRAARRSEWSARWATSPR